MTQEQKAFIERVGALAAADMQKSGVLASLTIAQAILESGWGKSGLTVKANALFGIKAGTNWKGRVYSAKTQECYDGVNFTTVTALFRAYDSWEESVADHSALLTGAARYKAVIGERDYKTACRAIKAAGYATAVGGGITVALNTQLSEELLDEGTERELISKIQTMRKEAGFEVTDRIAVYFTAAGRAEKMLKKSGIAADVLAVSIAEGSAEGFSRTLDVNGDSVTLTLVKAK